MGGHETQHSQLSTEATLDTAPDIEPARVYSRFLRSRGLIGAIVGGFAVLIFGLAQNARFEDIFPFAAAIWLAGWLLAMTMQRGLMQHVLTHPSRLKPHGLHIGKDRYTLKPYAIADSKGVKLKPGQTHETAILMTAIASVSRHDPLDLVDFSKISDKQPLPFGSAHAVVSEFGKHNQKFVFIYGTPESVTAHTKDLWDFGHTRRFSATDHETISKSASIMSRHASYVMAFAYAPLPKGVSASKITPQKLADKLTFLGLASFKVSDRSSKIRTPAIAANLARSTSGSLVSQAAISALVVISLLASLWLEVPAALGIGLLLLYKAATEMPLMASLNWDTAHRSLKQLPRMRQIVCYGLLLGGLVFANYLWLFIRAGQSLGDVDTGSLLHERGLSLSFLTLSLGVLVYTFQSRSSRLFHRSQLRNRYFWISVAFALFWTISAIYNPLLSQHLSTQPLSLADWLWALVAVGIFAAIRELETHSRDHSRDHIMDLVRAYSKK